MSREITPEEAQRYLQALQSDSDYVVIFRQTGNEDRILWTPRRDRESAITYVNRMGGYAFKRQCSYLPIDGIGEESW